MVGRTVLAPGTVFAGYTVERLLGVGGMGAVYLATHPRLPLRVALKLLHREFSDNDYVRARFESEAENVARLDHPNIVGVQDRGRDGDQSWIVMQYVDGTSAEEVVRRGPLDVHRTVFIVVETAKALDYAHSKGVLHRDVKPDNILLENDSPGRRGRVLLADFGIAKALSETRFTQTGMLVASLPYAAPEQFEGKVLDARADVYSLGCTLFHLLTGRLPFPGASLPQLMHGHLAVPVPRASLVWPGVPMGFDNVIRRAMAKDREDRYPSCGALAAAAVAVLSPPAHASRPPEREQWAETVPARVPLVDARARRPADVPADQRMIAAERPPWQPRTAGTTDLVFRNMARAGLIVLTALICAALFTWSRTASYYDYYYRHYFDYQYYQPFRWRIGTSLYSEVRIAVLAVAVVGVALILVSLISVRSVVGGRVARAGAWLLLTALFILELAFHTGTSATAKNGEMMYIALLAAALLLVGCWRGLTPSTRNALLFVSSGVVVLALCITPRQFGLRLWALSEGAGGLIAGFTLVAAGVMLEIRRRRVRNANPVRM